MDVDKQINDIWMGGEASKKNKLIRVNVACCH